MGVWRNQMPLPVKACEFYEKQVQEWKRENVVEEMYDLPAFQETDTGTCNINGFAIVSGKPRIVHNFKPLNSLIHDDTCEVPGIDVAFDKISRKRPVIYSKIDLKSAYLQIPLRKRDRNLTAFTCNGKRYRFITSPLGLKTIPSQF